MHGFEGDRFEIEANLRVNPRVNNLKRGAVAGGELRSPRVTAGGRHFRYFLYFLGDFSCFLGKFEL